MDTGEAEVGVVATEEADTTRRMLGIWRDGHGTTLTTDPTGEMSCGTQPGNLPLADPSQLWCLRTLCHRGSRNNLMRETVAIRETAETEM